MNESEIRRLLAEEASASKGDTGCVDANELWALCLGEVKHERVEQILHHALGCGICGDALEAARLGVAEVAPEVAPEAVPPRSRVYLRVAVAAAAVLLLAVALPWMRDRFDAGTPTVRGAVADADWLNLDHGAPLARDAFVLRWRSVGATATYSVDVFSGDLDVLAQSGRLSDPVYRVDAGLLASIAAGDTILWRVQAHLPTGESSQSPVFRTAIAP